MKPSKNKEKTSAELLQVMVRNGYAYWDERSGRIIMELTRLQREQSIQSVSQWPGMVPILMGHLRESLHVNGRPPLRDEGYTPEHKVQAFIYDRFGRKVK